MKTLFLLLLASNIFALNQAEFRELLIKNHPKFIEFDLTTQNTNLAKKIANPSNGYNFSSKINYLNNDGNNNNSVDYITNSLTSSLSRKHQNGSDTVLSHTLSKTEDKYDNSLSVNHNIPLNKNKGGINDNLNYDLADFDIQINILQDKINRETFINNQIKKLIDLKFLSQKLIVIQQKNKIDKEQLKIITDKFEQGLVDQTDVLSQQISLTANKLDIFNLQEQINKLKDEIKNLLNITNFKVDFNLENLSSITQVDNNNLSNIKILELKIAKLQRELKSLNNQDLSDINLALSATLNGDNNTLGKAFSEVGTTFAVGLEIALPLASDLSKNQILSKTNQIQITKEQIKSQLIDNNNNINSLINDIATTNKLISLSKEQIELNSKSATEYQKLYNDNNTELNFVLSAKNKLISSQLSLLEYLKTYHILMLDYKTSTL
jgi:outer membrane protein TolC